MNGSQGAADCILFGGTIHTMDPLRPRAEAIAIRGGRIVHVGDAGSARALAGPRTERIDLRGRVALPGFIENHTHLIMYGRSLEQVDCRELRSMAEIIAALRERAATLPPGQWVVGHTYDDTLLAEMRHPTRHDLDQASRDHPILLVHISAHNAVLNSLGLQMAGVTVATPDPAGGSIGRDAAGEPTGILWEWAQNLVRPFLPDYGVEDICRHLQAGARRYLAAGVTSAVEAAVGFADGMKEAEAIARLAAAGGLPLRYGAAIQYALWQELRAGAGPGLEWGGDPEWVRPAAVKLFQDGSIQLRTAALRQPYYGQAGPADGHLIWPQEQLDRMVAEVHAAGWQIWIHGNGDAAIASILDAYERALAAHPRADHRHRIEHCQTVGEDQLDRMAALGVTASFFAAHVWHWGDRHQALFLGPERAARIDPLASALRRGIRFGLHNDTPVTPIHPLLSIGTAVSRLTRNGQVLGPEQAIAVGQALRAMTLDSAYLAFEEGIKGSLEEGKLGDVVVLEADPYRVPPGEIKDIPVALTIVGGQVAYSAG